LIIKTGKKMKTEHETTEYEKQLADEWVATLEERPK
jgi:hypothetical protein